MQESETEILIITPDFTAWATFPTVQATPVLYTLMNSRTDIKVYKQEFGWTVGKVAVQSGVKIGQNWQLNL